MGFFKSITHAITHPVQTVTKVVSTVVNNPVRALTAGATGGLSEVARIAPVIGKPYQQLQTVQDTAYKAAANIYTGGTYGAATNAVNSLVPSGGSNMGFNIGSFLGGIGNIFGQSDNSYISGAGQIASAFAPAYSPQQSTMPQYGNATPVMAQVPRIAAAGSAVATVGRRFFQKFPNLATSMQMLRNQGRNLKRSQLYSMLKRFGPEMLVTGGILSAAAVNELLQAGPGSRRMNPGNAKALRRSLRRLESFHHLCQRADKFRRHRTPARKAVGRGAATFVRQG